MTNVFNMRLTVALNNAYTELHPERDSNIIYK